MINITHLFNQREKRALFVGLDLETTGTDPSLARIVQFASVAQLIKHYVTTMTQGGEQTEAHIFSHFEKRASTELINEALDELMDEGVVRSTIIDAQTMGFGFLPGLCRAVIKE